MRKFELSIDARIAFRDPDIDSIVLSDLNVLWRGACRELSPGNYLSVRQLISSVTLHSPIVSFLVTLVPNNDRNFSLTGSLTGDNQIRAAPNHLLVPSSTLQSNESTFRRFLSFVDHSNIRWLLSLIVFLCVFLVLSSFVYGLWSIKQQTHLIWYLRFDSPIQFVARHSIRSSAGSQTKSEQLSRTSTNLFRANPYQESLDSFTTATDRSTTSSLFSAYF